MSKKDEFIFGFKKAIPITMGYIPMGIGYAALAIKAGLTPLQTVGFSILVYAGAGEIIAVTMLLNGATAFAIILTNFVVNLRYFVMNVCVYNKVQKTSPLLNALSCHLTTDESFAMFSLMDESSIWTYVGLSLTSWLSWILGAAIGVFVLDLLPVIVTNSFNISLYALFVAILIPNVKKNYRIGLLVIITGIMNIILQTIIGNWSIIVSTLLGALIGVYLINDAYFLTDDGGIK
ncbi:MAG: AzlC family ABC transporter permease [Methanosphaera sp.]|uniref:AzlC family ABC transporter permease n=1 Tax=Methanosphaera sp. TaxID=2666342 RepID=UPI002E7646FE|nr:AzlC family ABC transporter permease [Methanosphaera sp.]MBE6486834.1 branched-chain amino acid ABC transporter permease [Methanosphaera stadtmanae]MEE1116644.1 AzlC family ABC transporter permease [Methanosphaera sp.]MEE3324620.1 AzlC family ABC transporter permease [Methanosphaera sp.]